MSLQTLNASLSSMDVEPGSSVSFRSSARTIHHEVSHNAMILRGIHATKDDILSALDQLEIISSRFTGQEETHLMLNTYIHQLRCQIEDISQMTNNVEERLSRSLSEVLAAGASDGSELSIASNEEPSVEHPDTTPSSETADDEHTEDDDDGNASDTSEATLVPETTNPAPPLLPAPEIMLQYYLVMERRIKRRISEVEEEEDDERENHQRPVKKPRHATTSRKERNRANVYQRPSKRADAQKKLETRSRFLWFW